MNSSDCETNGKREGRRGFIVEFGEQEKLVDPPRITSVGFLFINDNSGLFY